MEATVRGYLARHYIHVVGATARGRAVAINRTDAASLGLLVSTLEDSNVSHCELVTHGKLK